MRTRRIPLVAAVFAAVMLLFGAVAPRLAHADPKKDIQQKIKEAMESYDLLEYEDAKKALNSALSMAKRAHLDNAPIAAQIHLRMGIILGAGLNDTDGAKREFAAAAKLDPNVDIDAAYKTKDLEKLLEAAKAGAGGGGGGGGGDVDTGGGGGGDVDTGGGGDEQVDCKTVHGLQHTIIDSAKGGAALSLVAYLGRDVKPAKVSIMYRAKGAVEFKELKMTQSAGCRYSGEIPAKAMRGDLLHYYIAAYNGAGKVIASKGSSGSPNIVEVAGGGGDDGGGLGDDEDPLHAGGGHKAEDHSGSSGVSGGVKVGAKHPKVFLTIAGGTGGGYVTGETEQEGNKVACCFAPALAHIFGEIGYFATPTTSISLAGRFGLVLGANIMGHSPGAPSAMIRLRHLMSPSGKGLVLNAAIGAGVIRNTVKLDQPADPSMNVDVVAMGPMLLGGGVGYLAPLSGNLKFDAEVNALAGIPIKSDLGSSHLVFGVEFDLTLGLQIGF